MINRIQSSIPRGALVVATLFLAALLYVFSLIEAPVQVQDWNNYFGGGDRAWQLVGNLALTTFLSAIVAETYRRLGETFSGLGILARTLPLLAVIVYLVVAAVQTSLALSLGLVGAISIVRFRTPIKDVEDLCVIFWSIAIGVTIAAGKPVLATVGTAAALIVYIGFKRLRGERERARVFVLVKMAVGEGFNLEGFLQEAGLDRASRSLQLQRFEERGQELELVFRGAFSGAGELDGFRKRLKAKDPNMQLTVIESGGAAPL